MKVSVDKIVNSDTKKSRPTRAVTRVVNLSKNKHARRQPEVSEPAKKTSSSSGSMSLSPIRISAIKTSMNVDESGTGEESSFINDTTYYPYSIVWTPLPVITWFIPVIGHTGISNSKGVIYDFSDDFNVSIDNFSFGEPTKFYKFDADLVKNGSSQLWDRAIQETSDFYSKTRHSFFFNNCHQYIASVLNKVKYANRSDWTQTEVWTMITVKSEYTSTIGFVRQWWPFAVILFGIVVFLVIAL